MNIQNLKADTDFLCGSTSATYPDTHKIRNFNIAYADVARTIWESDGGWSYDDSNNTDAPVAYKTLGNASGSYTIPTTAIMIEAAEVMTNGGDWQKLNPLAPQDVHIAQEEYMTEAGMPVYYMLQGNTVRLFPPPSVNNVTLASGLAIILSRNVNEIATSATTSEPGFASPFHRILSLAAAIDFSQDVNQKKFLLEQRYKLEAGLTRFYSKRGAEFKTQMKPAGKRVWRQYI